MAEIAHELGRDPKDFLLELIGPARIVDLSKQVTTAYWNNGEPIESYPMDTGRMRQVVEVAAARSGWGRQMPKGRGLGLAVHRSFVSYVATVVEVAVDEKGHYSIPRIDTAIDCGYAVNPDRIRSQIEGAAVMGLTLAKYGEITYKDGRVERATSTTSSSPGLTNRRPRPGCTSSSTDTTCPRAVLASPASRPSRRHSATRSSPPPASVSVACRSAISSRFEPRWGAGKPGPPQHIWRPALS